jgi:tetratricopeptide (TPR) repeat protein
MSYTIQQIEEINFNQSSHQPEELIPMAKQMQKIKKHEKALEILEAAIKKIINKYNGDETHLECARYYYHYADCLISKLMDNPELFDNPQEAETTQPEHNSLNNIQEVKNKNDDQYSDDEEVDGEEDNAEPVVCDEEIAFDNLAVAEKILKDQKDYISLDLLANVYLKMGELEMCKSNTQQAIEFYEQSLNIRSKIDKFSRTCAELYFYIGGAYDFDMKKSLLSYYKTKVIMEYHLKNELKEAGEVIKINESDLILEELDRDKIVLYNELLQKCQNDNLSEDAAELIDILCELYVKVYSS